MNIFKILITFLNFFFIFSFNVQNQSYQVVTSHLHDLNRIKDYIKTTHQDGRLWIVEVADNSPSFVFNYLKPIQGNERSYLYQTSVFSPAYFQNNILNYSSDAFYDDSYIISFLDKVNRENIKRDVEHLSGFKTRYAGSKDNQIALKDVAFSLKSYGYDVKKICHANEICNVFATKKGAKQPDKMIVVLGHIDSVGKAFAGADDNASGVAVLTEMARVLFQYDNQKTLGFFVSNSEEQGLIGATYWAKILEKENKLKDIELVINMDMVGYNFDGVVELETNPEFDSLARWFANIAKKYTQLIPKITLGAWGSDHVPFLNRGVPSLLTIENWQTKTPCYHKSCDTPDTLNYDYASDIAKLNLAAVITKDKL